LWNVGARALFNVAPGSQGSLDGRHAPLRVTHAHRVCVCFLIVGDLLTQPLARYWTARLDLSF